MPDLKLEDSPGRAPQPKQSPSAISGQGSLFEHNFTTDSLSISALNTNSKDGSPKLEEEKK
jgi:hypothetical protein